MPAPSSSAWSASRARSVPLRPFAIMGILNVTPDSFSDGGAHVDVGRACDRAMAMIAEGASVIDIGGESTRPGAARVDATEQRRRVEPVIAAIRRSDGAIALSVDTTLSAVAAAALDTGADAVNDVSACTEDDRMLPLVARRECGVVLMHRVVPPEQDSLSTALRSPFIRGDAVRELAEWATRRAAEVQQSGVAPDRIVIDPGLGFGKTVEQNWALIARIGEIVDRGYPVLVGASRKSFVGHATEVDDPARRVVGSAVAAAIAHAGGASIIRTHDVRATREALLAMRAALAAHEPSPAR